MDDKSKRQEKLADLWTLMADAVIRAMSADAPSAATLNAARLFLSDNGVTVDVLRDWRRQGFAPGELPKFDDAADEASDGGATTDALKKIPPFDNA